MPVVADSEERDNKGMLKIEPQNLPIIAVSPRQAATMLGIEARAVDGAVRSRELPAHKRGRAVKILLSELEAWVKGWPHPQPHTRRKKDDASDAAQ